MSRVWSVVGQVMSSSIGTRSLPRPGLHWNQDLAYANAIEIIRESTDRALFRTMRGQDSWKSFDRSEPPVGAITVLGIYKSSMSDGFCGCVPAAAEVESMVGRASRRSGLPGMGQ